MTLNLPTKLEEITLGQLEAVGRFIQLDEQIKGKELTEQQKAELKEVYAEYLNITVNSVELLQSNTLQAINGAIVKLIEDINLNYRKCFESHNGENSFTCLDYRQGEILSASIDDVAKKWWQRKKSKKMLTPVVFSIDQPHFEPAKLWIDVLDGCFKRIRKNHETRPYWEWFEIRHVLACKAWKDGAKRTKINEIGDEVVDYDEVNRKKELFKEIPATTAIKVFGFFFAYQIRFFQNQFFKPVFEKVSHPDFQTSQHRKTFNEKWGWQGYCLDVMSDGNHDTYRRYLVGSFQDFMFEAVRISERSNVAMNEAIERKRKMEMERKQNKR